MSWSWARIALAPATISNILGCAKGGEIFLLPSALVKWLLAYSVQERLQDKVECVHWREPTYLGDESTCPERRGWGGWNCSAWSRDDLGSTWRQPCNYLAGSYREPGSLLTPMVSGKTSQYAKQEQVAQWDSITLFLAGFADPPGQRPQKVSLNLV